MSAGISHSKPLTSSSMMNGIQMARRPSQKVEEKELQPRSRCVSG